MPKSHVPYPPEFKRRLVEMVRAGRTPEELAEKFEPTAQSIRNWVAQADRDDGHRQDGLSRRRRGPRRGTCSSTHDLSRPLGGGARIRPAQRTGVPVGQPRGSPRAGVCCRGPPPAGPQALLGTPAGPLCSASLRSDRRRGRRALDEIGPDTPFMGLIFSHCHVTSVGHRAT